jgi:hypothetical protein
MLRRVAFVRTNLSGELSTSFIRLTRIGELGTTLAGTSNRRTLRRENLKSYMCCLCLKSKAIPVTGRGGLWGCKTLRIPHCIDNRLTDGGKVVSPTHRPLLYSPETLLLCFWYSFLLEAE